MIWNGVLSSYLEKKKQVGDAMSTLVFMNVLTSLMAVSMSYIFLHSENLFAPIEVFCSPDSDSDFGFFHFEFYFWEILFLLAGIGLSLSVIFVRYSVISHSFAGFSWSVFGLMWLAASIIHHHTSLFGFGILGLFIATWHVAMARLWRAEDL